MKIFIMEFYIDKFENNERGKLKFAFSHIESLHELF